MLHFSKGSYGNTNPTFLHRSHPWIFWTTITIITHESRAIIAQLWNKGGKHKIEIQRPRFTDLYDICFSAWASLYRVVLRSWD